MPTTVLPWVNYQDIWNNAGVIACIGVKVGADRDDMIAVSRMSKRVRRWVLVAMAERSVRGTFPTLPCIFTAYAAVLYQCLCVTARTVCEANCPELIDLVTEVL